VRRGRYGKTRTSHPGPYERPVPPRVVALRAEARLVVRLRTFQERALQQFTALTSCRIVKDRAACSGQGEDSQWVIRNE